VKVLVCGSRDWSDVVRLRNRLAELPADAEIIHGAARGADRDAQRIARELGLRETAFPADWETYGKRAGIVRNVQMLDERPDLVIAFWDGKSPGTGHTVGEAKKRGIRVEVIA
jgi:hypothetical protein